jgi:hypothetical protein
MSNKLNLKAQFDHRKQMWKIMKQNPLFSKKGWQRFGGNYYHFEDECKAKIKTLTEQFPDQYKTE